ncbi:MAG: hypothetical protein K0S45_4339 [Nitrospira sp.]|nr:hypothetical protein [Nitrospira sp.]
MVPNEPRKEKGGNLSASPFRFFALAYREQFDAILP